MVLRGSKPINFMQVVHCLMGPPLLGVQFTWPQSHLYHVIGIGGHPDPPRLPLDSVLLVVLVPLVGNASSFENRHRHPRSTPVS